jgi:hypothetical protein
MSHYLTAVLLDGVGEPLVALGSKLEVVPRHELGRVPERVLGSVEVGYRVLAVVCDLLLRLGGNQLQEGDLVAVSLVGELRKDRMEKIDK